MSSESLHEILGTYSAIEALRKLARLDRPEEHLESSCACFSRTPPRAVCQIRWFLSSRLKNQLVVETEPKVEGLVGEKRRCSYYAFRIGERW